MLEMLKTLCEAGGVSGDEKEALDAAEKLLAPLGEIERTNLGSIICRLPKNGDDLPEVMLTAHIDRIGLIVTKITDKGFLKTAPCGGADRRSLSGA
ncbi:MAG: M42 family peptidase, partial [Oscillospiraceae bacterium]|nr:M42 family peptidase [Oscillospiraceae bacterium]